MKLSFSEIAKQLKQHVQLYKALIQDHRVPRVSRILLSAAIGYTLLPFDIIPDFIPVLGHLDDVIIVPGLIYLAIKYIPKEVYAEYKKKYIEK